MAKNLNPNRAKIHRNYLVSEVAELYGVHKNTVRQWIKHGLPLNDERRPVLILGFELRAFIKRKNQQRKQQCKPCEMYCLRCKSPQHPAGNMAEYEPMNAERGRLIAICPRCETMMNRYTNLIKLALIKSQLDISFPSV